MFEIGQVYGSVTDFKIYSLDEGERYHENKKVRDMRLDHFSHVAVEKTFFFASLWDMVFLFWVVCSHDDVLLLVVDWASRTAVGLQQSGFPCFDLK